MPPRRSAGRGHRVVVYDNLIAGHREAVKYGPFVEGDIADVAAVRDAIRRHQVFAVMHFAAFLDVGESTREPARYYRNNVIGALGVLEAMAAESVGYFVLSSTCATYGEPKETPIRGNAFRSIPSTVTGRPSWPSSGRCRTSSARTACAGSRSDISTRRAPTPTARSARIMRRRFT